MPYLFAALFGVGVYVTVFRSVRAAFLVAVVTMFFVPSNLNIPHAASYLFTMHRVEAFAFFGGMAYRSGRGELRPGAFRLTGATIALLGFVAVALLGGMFFASRSIVTAGEFNEWTLILAQWAFLVGCLAALREIDDPAWVAKVLAIAVMACAGVAWGEHFTRASYFRWLAGRLGEGTYHAAFPLERRGGHVRVRVFTEFALAFGWVMAAFVPFAIAVAAWARRRLWLALPVLVGVASVWTYTRSAYVGLAAGCVLLLFGTRFDRRVGGLMLAGAVLVAPVLVSSAIVHQTFHAPDAVGSSEVRTQRVPIILDIASHHPVWGVGLGGVFNQASIQGADATYLDMYAELGVAGVVALTLALLAALVSAGRCLRAPPGLERVLGASALAGVVVFILGAAFFDQFVDLQASEPVWLLTAFAIVIAERHVGPEPLRTWRLRRRAWMPVAGVIAGVSLLVTAPQRDAARFLFTTTSVQSDVAATSGQQYVTTVLENTACRLIVESSHLYQAADTGCFYQPDSGGVGEARIAVPAGADVLGTTASVMADVQGRLPGFQASLLDVRHHVLRAWQATAPIWAGGIALALALFLPGDGKWRRRRRRRKEQPEDHEPAVAGQAVRVGL